ncbi:homeobox-leucine zipper protein HAT3 [Nymphaea colorata]|nr:homeobox-leucine zipper protein HAT3 [Nymphaea colorata]
MAEEGLGLDLSLFSGSISGLQSKRSSDSSPRHRSSPICVDLSSERESETFRADSRHLFRRIDVNRVPAMTDLDDCEEEEVVATASSPTSTVSSLSLSGTKRGADNDLLMEEERASSRGGGGGAGAGSGASDEEDTSRKKLRLSKDQSAVLEESFKEHPTLNPKQKMALAKQLNLRPRQVEVWFQNRRARTKLKQTEVDCEFLKRCCENLTEENRRLQRELQELRALKLSPQFYMPIPATTLTMCPSCEKLAGMAASNNQCRIPAPAVGPIPVRRLDMPARS